MKRVPRGILAEIYGAEAVLKVAEEEVFEPNDVGHGGVTMYENRCGGCVNWALLVAAGKYPHSKFPGELTVDDLLLRPQGKSLEGYQFTEVQRLIRLNDTGKLQTREQVLDALTREMPDETEA